MGLAAEFVLGVSQWEQHPATCTITSLQVAQKSLSSERTVLNG